MLERWASINSLITSWEAAAGDPDGDVDMNPLTFQTAKCLVQILGVRKIAVPLYGSSDGNGRICLEWLFDRIGRSVTMRIRSAYVDFMVFRDCELVHSRRYTIASPGAVRELERVR